MDFRRWRLHRQGHIAQLGFLNFSHHLRHTAIGHMLIDLQLHLGVGLGLGLDGGLVECLRLRQGNRRWEKDGV